MRIGVDARPLTVPTFGIGRYTRELLDRLIAMAPEHDWFLYADRPILDPPISTNVTLRSFSKHNRIFSLARTQFTFSHWAELDKLDLYWSPRHHLPLFLNQKIKQLVTVHDIVWRKYPHTMQPMNLFVEGLLMPSSLSNADKIIAVSNATKRDLVESLAIIDAKVEVIHEAATRVLDLDPPREIEVEYFFFVGTHEPRKNLDRLLEAFEIYRSSGGRLQLVIAGDEGWGAGGHIGEDSGVQSLGYVSDERLNGLMTHATALVFPSLYEGFGLPLLESIQRGVPVITSNVSSMPEVAGDAGLLVDPLDVNSIASGMLEMGDPAKRNFYAPRCDAQSKKFSWGKSAKSTLDVIESLVQP